MRFHEAHRRIPVADKRRVVAGPSRAVFAQQGLHGDRGYVRRAPSADVTHHPPRGRGVVGGASGAIRIGAAALAGDSGRVEAEMLEVSADVGGVVAAGDVGVEHGDDVRLFEITREVGGDGARAEQALLLTGEGHEYDRGIVLMAGEDAGQLEDHAGLGAGIIAARRVGGTVGDDSGARVVVAADDHQAVTMATRKPGNNVEGRRVRADVLHDEGIESNLQSGDRAVLGEEVVARSGDTLARSRRVRAGLACPKILQALRRVQNVAGIDIREDAADFRIGGNAPVARCEANHNHGNGEHESAVKQRSLHGHLLRGQKSGKN